MAFKKSTETKSFLANTVGSVGMEQIMVVATVGLLGIGGFTLLGGGMDEAIAGKGQGGMATSQQAGAGGAPIVSAEAGTGIGPIIPPVGPSAAAKAAAVIAKSITNSAAPELHFGHKHHGSGESFLGGLKRSAFNLLTGNGAGDLDWLLPGHGTGIDDLYRGVATLQHDALDVLLPDSIMNPLDRGLGLVGSVLDQALPGDGLLPGDVLDGILPGHGFLGEDGFLTSIGNAFEDAGSGIADFFGWNDDVHAESQLKEFNVEEAYELTEFNSNAVFTRLNDIYANIIQNPKATPEQIASALLSIDGILEGNPTEELQKLAKALRSRGADEAAALFEQKIAILNDAYDHAIRYEKELLAIQKTLPREANPVIADAAKAVYEARVFARVAEAQNKKMPQAVTVAGYKSLKTAEAALVQQIEGFDAALSEDLAPARRASLTAQRAELARVLNVVVTNTAKLLAQSKPGAVAGLNVTVELGEAQVLERGGEQTTRGGN